jgi:hypothetical protein
MQHGLLHPGTGPRKLLYTFLCPVQSKELNMSRARYSTVYGYDLENGWVRVYQETAQEARRTLQYRIKIE